MRTFQNCYVCQKPGAISTSTTAIPDIAPPVPVCGMACEAAYLSTMDPNNQGTVRDFCHMCSKPNPAFTTTTAVPDLAPPVPVCGLACEDAYLCKMDPQGVAGEEAPEPRTGTEAAAEEASAEGPSDSPAPPRRPTTAPSRGYQRLPVPATFSPPLPAIRAAFGMPRLPTLPVPRLADRRLPWAAGGQPPAALMAALCARRAEARRKWVLSALADASWRHAQRASHRRGWLHPSSDEQQQPLQGCVC